MTTERLVRIVAGSFVLVSLALAWRFDDVRLFDGPTWLWFTAFVGANLLQSGVTRWCLLEDVLARLGVGDRRAGDVSPSPCDRGVPPRA
jgi:hypothetical protein